MENLKSKMVEYILTQVPKEFRGKENWLGVKMSPHMPFMFINKITNEGIETNEGDFPWNQCGANILSTIYQRLKLNEATNK